MQIIKATSDHLDDLIPLFDSYRQFYRQKPDTEGARKFLQSRFQEDNSIIYMAYENGDALGFTQLYHLFSSVSMEPMLLLNDLYIKEQYRNRGIGQALIEKAKQFCKINCQKGLAIETQNSNRAQYLYKRLGFEVDTNLHLFWKCD